MVMDPKGVHGFPREILGASVLTQLAYTSQTAELLRVIKLTTSFFTQDGEVKAVDGVSFVIKAGEVIGIVGESGCGKTVTALSILQLVPHPPGRIIGGHILYNGEDLLKFKEKHQLNFELWSDPDHELMEAFQVWGERNFMGKKYMGVSRSTFLINPEGMIVKVWEKVQPLGHGEEVLKALKVSLKD